MNWFKPRWNYHKCKQHQVAANVYKDITFFSPVELEVMFKENDYTEPIHINIRKWLIVYIVDRLPSCIKQWQKKTLPVTGFLETLKNLDSLNQM